MEEKIMSFKYEIKEQHAQPTVSIRTKTSLSKLPEVIHKSYDAIEKHIAKVGGTNAGAPFVIYYNMDINDLDVELGFPVAKNISEYHEVKNSQTPAGKALEFTHVGPYNELEKAYRPAMTWIKESNFKESGIVCEFYMNDPAVTPPEDLITEIKIFLKN